MSTRHGKLSNANSSSSLLSAMGWIHFVVRVCPIPIKTAKARPDPLPPLTDSLTQTSLIPRALRLTSVPSVSSCEIPQAVLHSPFCILHLNWPSTLNPQPVPWTLLGRPCSHAQPPQSQNPTWLGTPGAPFFTPSREEKIGNQLEFGV